MFLKLKVLEKYDENDIVINKMDFMKILLKYKVNPIGTNTIIPVIK